MATKVNFKESEKELKLKIEELRLNKKQKEKEQNETEKENKQEETHELEQQLKNRAAQLEKKADGLVLTFYYDEAIDQYTKAQETYEEANDSSKAESIYKKIDKVELKQKELELKKKQLDAEAIETKADESLADLDYVKALEYYTVAQSQYQTINQLDKVFEIERIMRGIEDLQKSINENSYNNLQ